MTTVFEVNSSLCGNKTQITAELVEKSKIKINIESTCPKVKKYAELLNDLGVRELVSSMIDNPVYIKAAHAKITPDCLIPSGAMLTAWTEAGMVSKNLLKKCGPQCIIFIK